VTGLRNRGAGGLVAEALRRIAATDGRIRAFTQVFDPPLHGSGAGPLTGIPIAVKDNVNVAGQVTGLGRPLDERPPAPTDAAVVAAVRAAGAVIVGKTNLPEFASSAVTDNVHSGATRNPADPTRTAGGSSGGSAAAVAAGMVPVAIGTDTAGSVLMPAALTGCCGFRPTPGVLDTAGIAPLSPTLDTVGAFAAAPDDLAFVLDTLLPSTVDGPRPVLGTLRIGAVGDHFREAEPAVLATVDVAFDRLRAVGARIVPVTLPAAGDALRHGRVIYRHEVTRSLATLLRTDRTYAFTVEARRHPTVAAADVAAAHAFLPAWRAEVGAVFDTVDVLAVPAVPMVAPVLPVDEDTAAALIRFTYPVCLAGLPAVSIPCAGPCRLPVGLLLAGRPGTDRALLAVADAVHTLLTPAKER
jgi:aspartyl-tRNA(Asn)/glutamyl-tRNA(Gln) amidotransferase subunit A